MDVDAPATDVINEKQRAKQRRRDERIAVVLDATERYAREVDDLEELSSTLIASLSGVSVGWLYSHIGDRQAVVDAVLLRGLREMQAVTVAVGLDVTKSNWAEQLELLVDSTVNRLRSRRGFARLYYSRLAGPATAEVNFEIDQETASSVFGLVGDALSPARAAAVSSMVTGIIDKGLEVSFRLDEFDSSEVIGETKAAVVRYLAGYLDAA